MSDPFTHDPRRKFSVLERAKLFARSNGHCEKCTRKIQIGEDWDIDHRIPLAVGGTNDDDNLQVLCCWCHDDKTPDDLANAAKSKRVYAQHVVPRKFHRSRAWGRRSQ